MDAGNGFGRTRGPRAFDRQKGHEINTDGALKVAPYSCPRRRLRVIAMSFAQLLSKSAHPQLLVHHRHVSGHVVVSQLSRLGVGEDRQAEMIRRHHVDDLPVMDGKRLALFLGDVGVAQ